ncbi:N-6 DNA methylase [Caballeronia sp. LZ008]|uniref:Eco57I restriction-modification methylase domain-containing protein n=1 Tax=Caballeronia sp. LZ008 TaxID=3038560 RepID=UPI0028667B7B|nr:N-6 DNA methylase [Caballeronia sp. LZ008]MDR5798060.1 N-6 DNA methylase [Caballeronia sp. LZ008]
MKEIRTEQDLVAISAALIGSATMLSKDEAALLKRVAKRVVDAQLIASVRARIEDGEDPLGDAFSGIRSPEERRSQGATYTPLSIIQSMVNWAASTSSPARIVDPGAGSGRFLLEAGERFKKAKLIGIEMDPLAALMLRANLAVRGLEKRSTVIVDDYRQALLPAVKGQSLFIGNPPYVRHHNIGTAWKDWFGDAAAEFGVKASKLAGLHIHFFVRTLQLAKDGDVGAFITSSEWLDVNYGSALRSLLAKELGGVGLHILNPKAMPFSDATTTGAIACFNVGRRPETLKVREVETLSSLNCLSAGNEMPWDVVSQSKRWSTIIRPSAAVPAGYIELGELCRVHRGQVTGGNAVWIAGQNVSGMPASVLKATITKAKDLLNAGEVLKDASALRKVIDLPADLDELDDPEELKAVRRFLKWAKQHGADQSYIAQHRRAWWAVGLKEPAPIICTYMARRAPAFVRNLCGARHINIAHGVYPRQALDDKTLDRLGAWLRENVKVESGRTYAGGLTKFEPKEVERILIPKEQFI